MEISQLAGYILAILVGISLGLMGSGGSILTVPILVYVMGVSPVLAAAYSLFVVGTTATVGTIRNIFDRNIDFNKVLVFGIPSVVAVFLTRIYLVGMIPLKIVVTENFFITKGIALMVLFAIVMLLSSYMMLRKQPVEIATENKPLNYPLIFVLGIGIGLIAGLVGAGGGFLIVPALVILGNTKMKPAVGTSLCIVALQSLIGFAGDLQQHAAIDWKLLIYFTTAAVSGIFIGLSLARKIEGAKLKKGFGWFVLAMGIYILIRELS
ncbi:sulfite exporter TauE/SafE family protein [Flavobacterium sp. 3HN19-14]|uniref:sulfite exporter TauE/SafE family protein n=1 Tax=Flavobacterium sp. 3HN19-14 TaxID=3448133 RepID=UPI003EE2B8F9